jgi:hypothetical protein
MYAADPRALSCHFAVSLVGNVVEDRPLAEHAKPFIPAVAQTVGFGLGRSKMLCLSKRID